LDSANMGAVGMSNYPCEHPPRSVAVGEAKRSGGAKDFA
jgi:hypothetical protein